MALCDIVVTTTQTLKEELENYSSEVIINRNLASEELVRLSQETLKDYTQVSSKIKIGYFSGSITHNENFEMIKPAIMQILEKYPHVELHLVGYIDLPQDLKKYTEQIIMNDYVDWKELPRLISQMDINLAPLVDSVFNRAKSEIKWLEAALVKVPTVASYLGSFEEMVKMMKQESWPNPTNGMKNWKHLLKIQANDKRLQKMPIILFWRIVQLKSTRMNLQRA